MTVTSRLHKSMASLAAIAACALPLAVAAQTIAYDGGGDSAGAGTSGDSAAAPAKDSRPQGKSRGGGGRSYGVRVDPYIEAAQIVTKEMAPGDEVLTYSSLAAGVDASIAGRNNAASVSMRYERRFGWGRADDGDTLSGIARGYTTLLPGLRVEAGGLAARTKLEENGAAVLSPLRTDNDSVTQVYSVYAGPTLATHAGDVAVNASYRIGYTKMEAPDSVVVVPGQNPVDVFDDSLVQLAEVHAGVKPHEVLPVGLGAGAQYYREDISNLDQRVEDFSARGDVTVEVTPTVALVGGVGYESVQISSRDALRGPGGLPVVGPDGRYVTDKSGPRIMAYDVDGLIWDAGVIWRPSRRTALEAHVGRRYGATSYYGSFAYAPSSRSAINVSVYDNIAGFGGQLNRALIALPTEFEAVRNPLTGDIGGCVASLQGGSCLGGALGSVRSATFRARGIMATYSVEVGRLTAGIGGGYDRRKFIAAPGTILASANGVIDENYWLAAFLNGRIDERSGFRTNLYANWFQTGSGFTGDTTALGATASYYRTLTRRLEATAAVGLDGVSREAPFEDDWMASALVGLRYSF